MLQMMPVVVFWLMLRVIPQHPILHLHPNLTIKGNEMMNIEFLDLQTTTTPAKNCHSLKSHEILLKETKEESLFKMELCHAMEDSNKAFVYAMSDMSKYFMVMAETMKISLQQMAIIQQQHQQHSMVSTYQRTHHSNLYSAQQAQ